MSLVEGQYLEQIEEADEGWLHGVCPGDRPGLFTCKHDLTKVLSLLIWRYS